MSFKKGIYDKISSKKQKEDEVKLKQMIDENKILNYKIKDLKMKNNYLQKNLKNLINDLTELKKYNENLSQQQNNEKKRLIDDNLKKENIIKELTNEKILLQQVISEKENIINRINKYININEDLNILHKKLSKYKKQEIINKIIKKDYTNLTIAIKSPHPQGTKNWGDYFFSLSLKKSFEKIGCNVIIHERENWYNNNDNIDIVIVLRGLIEYEPNLSNINLLWNISHPDMITKEEFEKYDIVFISSIKYANKINKQVNTIVKPLLQCTDPNIFYSEPNKENNDEILFVGSTRGVYRQIVKDSLNTDHDISIYGDGWDSFLDKKHIKGKFIPNKELHRYYSSCKILLNDHWEDMKNEDFPSNRLFDALACGTFVISDKIPSADTIFKGSIITYDNVDDLNSKLNYYLIHDEKRMEISKKGKDIVLKNHTFDKRANEILMAITELNNDY